MEKHLHLDFETFSKADLKCVGAYRYAFDPSTEILCAAMSLGAGEPVAWWQGMPEKEEWELTPFFDALEDDSVLIYAHNAQFEIAICQGLLEATWGIKAPKIERFRCTASLARRACLPASLEKIGEALELETKKDKTGKSLIKKFSVMQPAKKPTKKNPDGLPPCRIYPKNDPESFAAFVEYCRQDVRAEQQVAKALAYFDEPIGNRNFTLTEKINSRGVPANMQALRHAQKLVAEESTEVEKRFRELTGFEVTQTARLLEWVNSNGFKLDNLQAETLVTFLAENDQASDPTGTVEAIALRQSTSFASIKKIPAMLDCAGPHDNRLRGMLTHHGATTGRHSASLVQLQNMKRPTISTSESAYADLCAGASREWLEIVHGPVLEVISSCTRHFIQDAIHTPRQLIDADYAAIEARVVCWLAGQEDALQEYRDGADRYKVMASVIYGVAVEDVNKFPQRFVGKQATLGCGFGMGPSKFRATCANYGYDLPAGLEEVAVEAFRSKHKQVKQYWYDVEGAAKKAILRKGEAVKLRNLAFLHADVGGMPFLLIKLPSGRKLAYPKPAIDGGRITFYGQITPALWGRVDTYGGKLVENITQAVASDVMMNGTANAEAAGYEIATLIHDQALAYHKQGQTAEEFVRLLTELPAWAEGLPVEAEGGLVPFYKKD